MSGQNQLTQLSTERGAWLPPESGATFNAAGIAATLAAQNPVVHPQFKREVPPVASAFYLVRRAADPGIGVVFINDAGHVEAPGVSARAEDDRYCQAEECGQLVPAKTFKPVTAEGVINAPIPFSFGPRLEITEGFDGRMVATLIDW